MDEKINHKQIDDFFVKVNTYSINILNSVLDLFNFKSGNYFKKKDYMIQAFFPKFEKEVKQIMPFEDIGIFVVDEKNYDFNLIYKSENADELFILNEIDFLIENWSFAKAIREKRAILLESQRPDYNVVLHVMSTPSRVRGMFFATIKKQDMKDIFDISFLLLSSTLLVFSGFVESNHLYEILHKNNILYEKAIQKRTEQLKYQAYHDDLTSLPNRNYMIKILKELIDEKQENFSFIKLDLNRFKDINDSFGHDIGDFSLKLIGYRLREIAGSDYIAARCGGDEFALILPGIFQEEDLLFRCMNILEKCEQPFEFNNQTFQLDLSMGASIFKDNSGNLSEILRKADVALYKSKRDKSQINVYDKKFDKTDNINFFIKSDFKQAIKNNDIYPLFQPKYSFKEGKIIGVEALARWTHPVYGFISPARFIPVAEKSGIITKLTESIMIKSFLQSREWVKKGINLKIGINLSALDLQNSKFPDKILYFIKKYDVDISTIDFEITESTIMTDPEQAIENIKFLSGLGFSISLDDFGTGYSSLSYLHMFPVDNIKIDLSFVHDLDVSFDNRKIVQTIISLGKSLEKSIVAEGVENKKIAMILKNMGCDCIQGYYLSKPDKAELIEKKLDFSI